MKNEIVIYIKSGCPYCDLTKRWFSSKKINFKEIVLDCDKEREQFYKDTGQGVKTVPQIFINKNRIGGYMDLIKQESYVLFLINPSSIGEPDFK